MRKTRTSAASASFQPVMAAREGAQPAPGGPISLMRAAQIMFAKHTVDRQLPPVELDLSEYRAADFEYDTESLENVQRMIGGVPADARKMRWIHQDDAVLFYAERDLDVPYDDFVSRVDIAQVGLMFRDVLGITTEVLSQDERGRTLLQMERIAALTQPNYAAFLGKDELDVYKLQRMTYSPDEQRNWMRTVHSPNGSAVCDDGYLGFVRTETGTRITFLACQAFPMPRLMALLRLDRWTWLKNTLTENAYRRFTNTTMDNIEARYEGRDFRVGRPATGVKPTRKSPVGRALVIGGLLALATGALGRKTRKHG